MITEHIILFLSLPFLHIHLWAAKMWRNTGYTQLSMHFYRCILSGRMVFWVYENVWELRCLINEERNSFEITVPCLNLMLERKNEIAQYIWAHDGRQWQFCFTWKMWIKCVFLSCDESQVRIIPTNSFCFNSNHPAINWLNLLNVFYLKSRLRTPWDNKSIWNTLMAHRLHARNVCSLQLWL